MITYLPYFHCGLKLIFNRSITGTLWQQYWPCNYLVLEWYQNLHSTLIVALERKVESLLDHIDELENRGCWKNTHLQPARDFSGHWLFLSDTEIRKQKEFNEAKQCLRLIGADNFTLLQVPGVAEWHLENLPPPDRDADLHNQGSTGMMILRLYESWRSVMYTGDSFIIHLTIMWVIICYRNIY